MVDQRQLNSCSKIYVAALPPTSQFLSPNQSPRHPGSLASIFSSVCSSYGHRSPLVQTELSPPPTSENYPVRPSTSSKSWASRILRLFDRRNQAQIWSVLARGVIDYCEVVVSLKINLALVWQLENSPIKNQIIDRAVIGILLYYFGTVLLLQWSRLH
jgi:hypothetical protein